MRCSERRRAIPHGRVCEIPTPCIGMPSTRLPSFALLLRRTGVAAVAELGSLCRFTHMGRLVKLWKAEESDTRVVYSYGPSEDQRGRIACTKRDGAISLVEPIAGLTE